MLLVCGPHVIAGRFGTNGSRVSDLLNDPELEFLRLGDVRLLQGIRGPATEETSQAVVSKDAVELLLLLNEQHEDANHCYRVVQKSAVKVVCCAGPYQLRGTVHLSDLEAHRPDPLCILTKQTSQFFALTAVELRNSAWQFGPLQVPVAIVNTDAVRMIALEDGPVDLAASCGSDDSLETPEANEYRSVLEELGF